MNQESILIVDDDPEITKMISDMLTPLGYSCKTTASSIEALEQVCTQDFDIIISDIQMPGIDGLKLIHEVHKNVTDIPFIIITGYSEQYSYDRVIGAGANDFIKKPFTFTELKSKLERIFKERQLINENMSLLEAQGCIQNPHRVPHIHCHG